MVRTVCDRCGSMISQRQPDMIRLTHRDETIEAALCSDCCRDLQGWVREAPRPASPPPMRWLRWQKYTPLPAVRGRGPWRL